MSIPQRSTVTALFTSSAQAERAVAALRERGIPAEEIGTTTGPGPGAGEPGCKSESGVTVGTGAGMGMLAGAALGGLAAGALPGMLAAGAAGGLLGALIDLGIPEESACFYQREWQAGQTLVTARPGERAEEVAELLRQQGGQEVRVSRS